MVNDIARKARARTSVGQRGGRHIVDYGFREVAMRIEERETAFDLAEAAAARDAARPRCRVFCAGLKYFLTSNRFFSVAPPLHL